MSETVPLDSVILPPVTLPPVIFPDIVALSPVISCATTELMTVNPAIDRIAAARTADIANILIVFIREYEGSLI